MFKKIDNIDIRFVEKEDLDSIYLAIDSNRLFLSEYLEFANKITRLGLKNAIDNSEAMQILGKGFKLGLFDKGECLGICSLTINQFDNRGEIGYWLVEKATGKGLMTDATRQLVDVSFRFYRLNKLTIRCVDTNVKSIAIPKRLGFQKEGRLREHQKLNGEYRDLLVYSKLRSEWLEEEV